MAEAALSSKSQFAVPNLFTRIGLRRYRARRGPRGGTLSRIWVVFERIGQHDQESDGRCEQLRARADAIDLGENVAQCAAQPLPEPLVSVTIFPFRTLLYAVARYLGVGRWACSRSRCLIDQSSRKHRTAIEENPEAPDWRCRLAPSGFIFFGASGLRNSFAITLLRGAKGCSPRSSGIVAESRSAPRKRKYSE